MSAGHSLRRRRLTLKAQGLVNSEKALGLRAAGKTLDEIAKALGFTHRSAARKAVNRAIARAHGRIADMATEYREIHNMRLERAIALIESDLNPPGLDELLEKPLANAEVIDQVKARQARAIAQLVRLLERQAKLLGLDAPIKTDLNVSTATAAETLAGAFHEIHEEALQPAKAVVIDSRHIGNTNLGGKGDDDG